jgi:glutaminyl-peptide cyclotransferase
MKHIFFFLFIIMLVSCKTEPASTPATDEKTTTAAPVKVPVFSKDSAFAYVEKQVSFGPRVPGSEGHKATRQWLVNKLKSYGASVTEQSFKANTSTIGEVRAANIIASFNPTYARRVVLGRALGHPFFCR